MRVPLLLAMLLLPPAALPAMGQTPPQPGQTTPKPKPKPAAKAPPVVNPARNTHAEKPKSQRRALPTAAGAAAAAAAAKAAAKPGGDAAAKPETPPPGATDAPPGTPPKKIGSGLELPRWASFRFEDVNLRVGPGTTFQIDWVYHRRDLPVKIEREYDVWRQIEDQDGIKGWVHQQTLAGRRSFLVKDTERVLRKTAADDAAPVARLKPGVVGRIRTCPANAAWCEVQVGDYRGFLKREEFWGTFPNEAVN